MSMIEPGAILAGKYAVECVVGRGGAGIVLAARHTTLKCRVAVKLLRTDSACDAETSARFVREGQIAAQIQSEHVARVLDAGTLPNGAPFLVMEYLEGCDLSALLQLNGPLSIEAAVEYVKQACAGLAAAHALDIVHRDLKPSNLFLTSLPDGSPLVKLIDFGIAEVKGALPSTCSENDLAVMGSLPFMAPEQLRGDRCIDRRSDIWALGAVLFALFSGRSPFERRYLTETCLAILTADLPDLSTLQPGLPRELGALIERCLAPEPEQRFACVAELDAALTPFSARARASSERQRRAQRRWQRRTESTSYLDMESLFG